MALPAICCCFSRVRTMGGERQLFVWGRSLLLTVGIKGFVSVSSQPLSNCHQTFLKIKEGFHFRSDINSFSGSLSVTQTHMRIWSWKNKICAAGRLSKDIPQSLVQSVSFTVSLQQMLHSKRVIWENEAKQCRKTSGQKILQEEDDGWKKWSRAFHFSAI